MATSVELKLRRARELRNMMKSVRDPSAKSEIEAASARLERNAAKQLKRVGRPVRRRTTGSPLTLVRPVSHG